MTTFNLAYKPVNWIHTYMVIQSNLSCQTASNCEYLQTLAAAAMTFVIFAITYYILTYTTCVQTFVRHTFKCLALLQHGNF